MEARIGRALLVIGGAWALTIGTVAVVHLARAVDVIEAAAAGRQHCRPPPWPTCYGPPP